MTPGFFFLKLRFDLTFLFCTGIMSFKVILYAIRYIKICVLGVTMPFDFINVSCRGDFSKKHDLWASKMHFCYYFIEMRLISVFNSLRPKTSPIRGKWLGWHTGDRFSLSLDETREIRRESAGGHLAGWLWWVSVHPGCTNRGGEVGWHPHGPPRKCLDFFQDFCIDFSIKIARRAGLCWWAEYIIWTTEVIQMMHPSHSILSSKVRQAVFLITLQFSASNHKIAK